MASSSGFFAQGDDVKGRGLSFMCVHLTWVQTILTSVKQFELHFLYRWCSLIKVIFLFYSVTLLFLFYWPILVLQTGLIVKFSNPARGNIYLYIFLECLLLIYPQGGSPFVTRYIFMWSVRDGDLLEAHMLNLKWRFLHSLLGTASL